MKYERRLPLPIAIAIVTFMTLGLLFHDRAINPIPVWSRVLGLIIVAVWTFLYFRTNKKKDD